MESASQDSQTQVSLQYLNSPEIVNALHLLLKIISSCRNGFIKIIQNSVGGYLIMTSSSSRLLQALSVSKPINRIIVSATQGHLQHFSDGGHFVAMLILQILTNSGKLNISYSYLSELYDKFLTLIIEDISSNVCKINLDISSLLQMTNFVKSIINTKPLCKLKQNESDHISKLLIQLFVNYLPCSGQTGSWENNIYMACDDGLSASETEMIHGILLTGYHIPKSMLDNLAKINGPIGVVVVTVSMTGDTEEMMDTEYEVTNDKIASNTVLSRIINFCDQCFDENVRVIFCQKVIHPQVKSHLYKQNILPVERIGAQMIQYLLKLTGACPSRSLSYSRNDHGYLDSLELRTVNKKSYLHLKKGSSPIATLLLSHNNEESVQELKAVCTSALHSMERLAYSSYVLPGGGCWEMMISYNLRSKVMSELTCLMEEYSCTKFNIISALDVCCHSLQKIAKSLLKESEEGKTDLIYHHFWRVPKEIEGGEITCSCGIYCLDISVLVDMYGKEVGQPLTCTIQDDYNSSISKRKIVTDQLAMCLNAIKTSFLTANSILSTNLFISDGQQ